MKLRPTTMPHDIQEQNRPTDPRQIDPVYWNSTTTAGGER